MLHASAPVPLPFAPTIAMRDFLLADDFDAIPTVLVPWIAARGQPSHAVAGRVDARTRIRRVLDRVRRGGSR